MAMQQFLSDASLFHEADAPGTFVKAYHTQVSRSGRFVFWGTTALLLPLEGLMIYLLLLLMRDPYSPLSLTFGIPLLLLVFVAPYAGFYAALWNHDRLVTPIRRKIVVSLYTGGLIYREGRKRQVVSWEQIRFVQRLPIKQWKTPRTVYKLRLHDASVITLNIILNEVEELATAIERALLQQLLPSFQADYEANRPMVFPGLCLNQHVISKSEEQISWQEVETITLGSEKLVIKARGMAKHWLAAPIVQFPNVWRRCWNRSARKSASVSPQQLQGFAESPA